MRQTTSVGISWQQGREEDDEDVEWVWLGRSYIAPPMQQMRFTVA